MLEPTDKKSDCYSAGERAWMEFGQQLRAKGLAGWLSRLTGWGVTPDAITYFSGLIGLGFVPLWLLDFKAAAIAMVAGHILLDGLDGPLARFQNNASPRGSFTDTLMDQIVITGVTIAWMLAEPTTASIAVGSCYVFLYLLVVAMAMVRNAMAIPYSWLVRPRFFVYLAIAGDWWFQGQFTVYVLATCDGLLAIKCLTGFVALRRDLPGAG